MSPFPWTDLPVIAGLVILNGLFAMSEMAIVSARPARLRVMAERGHASATAALKLASDPGRFLSTVQSGITLIGMIAGAYSGVRLGNPLGERLAALGVSAGVAPELGFTLAILGTTYVSLVFGELVPKQLALRHAEPIAMVAARPMAVFAAVTGPVVWVLDRSSRALLRLFGAPLADSGEVTAEELHLIMAEATRSGVIEEEQHDIMTGVMRLAERPVREVMTPRPEIDSIDIDAAPDDIAGTLRQTPHSLLPVREGAPDHIVGVVKARDLLAVLLENPAAAGCVRALMRKAEIVPDQIDAIDALRILQSSGVGMALVHDEYGGLQGIVTPADLLSALVGDFVSHRDEGEEPMIAEGEDGALTLAGSLPADALAQRLDIDLPEHRDFATAAGYALSVLKRLPQPGDAFAEQGWHFVVAEMDGRRIEKLHVRPLAPAEGGGGAG